MNVSFKRGLQSKIDSWLKTPPTDGFEAGSFYLTSDTDRLYFAQSATELVNLNRYVKVYATQDDLPTKESDAVPAIGDFAYVSNINALCVWNTQTTIVNDVEETKIGWVQINPDTTLDLDSTIIEVSEGTYEDYGD
jgi:hypothetical protein